MNAPRRVRLGAVSYLNSRPLTYGLDQDDLFEVHYAVPSACAEDLAAGRIDVGMIPIVEYARRSPGLRVVPDLAIGSRGEVLTVRLFCRGRLDRVRRVAADTSSRTSVVLLRLLLRERYGIDPEIAAAPPDLDAMLHGADAALLIGDPVLPLVGTGRDTGLSSLDLGREWHELTGRPGVFAVWAGPEGAAGAEHVARLQRARREGVAHITEIAAGFEREHAGSAVLYEGYLRDHICYDLGPAQVAGLTEFYRLAHRHRLIESVPELRFYP